jgi:hypothetical protein
VAEGNVKDFFPYEVNLQTLALSALLPVRFIFQNSKTRFERSCFEPLQITDRLQSFPLLQAHMLWSAVIFRPRLRGAENIVMGVVFCGKKATLCVCHGAHVVVDELGEFLGWPQSFIVAFVAPIAIRGCWSSAPT